MVRPLLAGGLHALPKGQRAGDPRQADSCMTHTECVSFEGGSATPLEGLARQAHVQPKGTDPGLKDQFQETTPELMGGRVEKRCKAPGATAPTLRNDKGQRPRMAWGLDLQTDSCQWPLLVLVLMDTGFPGLGTEVRPKGWNGPHHFVGHCGTACLLGYVCEQIKVRRCTDEVNR